MLKKGDNGAVRSQESSALIEAKAGLTESLSSREPAKEESGAYDRFTPVALQMAMSGTESDG